MVKRAGGRAYYMISAVAQKYMPEVTRDHNEMRALKQSFKA